MDNEKKTRRGALHLTHIYAYKFNLFSVLPAGLVAEVVPPNQSIT